MLKVKEFLQLGKLLNNNNNNNQKPTLNLYIKR